jgi:CHAT domain-containing protein
MARKRNLFKLEVSTVVKKFVLGLCCMLLVLSQGFFKSAFSIDKQQQAEQLTKVGFAQLYQGQASEAYESWKAANKIYRQLHNSVGISGTLINESLALQALGANYIACDVLVESLNLEDWICSSSIFNQLDREKQNDKLKKALQKKPSTPETQVIGLENLGNVLRLLGKLEMSEITLKKALEIAKFQNLSPKENAQLLLNLANTERNIYRQVKNKYKLVDEPIAKQKLFELAQSKLENVLETYQTLTTTKSSVALQAQLNELNLLLCEPEKWSAFGKNINGLGIESLINQILNTDFSKIPAIESIYARLNFLESLIQLSQDKERIKKNIYSNDRDTLRMALKFAEESLQVSEKLKNERAKSYSLGEMSKIYALLGDRQRQQELLNRAMGLAQSVQAWDIAYQWQQQMGRLYKNSGDIDKAIQSYAAAVASLEQVQGNLLSVDSEVQFSFKDKVEPVYQEYLELLLAQEKPNLNQAIRAYEKFKLAELENFLQCGRFPRFATSNVKSSVSTPPIIYLMNLGEKIEVIVKNQGGELYHYSPNAALVQEAVNSLTNIVQDPGFVTTKEERIQEFSKVLYTEILAPIKKYLPESGTLVFIPDTYFQSLPLGMLYDGKNYLIKSYNISIALGSSLWQPKALQKEQIKVLAAGISKQNPSFKDISILNGLSFNSLPEVQTEIASIKANSKNIKELLNAGFTYENFRDKISEGFPITHITSHGQFSSDPEKTFILTWDKVINVKELNSLLKRQNNIELLVLSACQTAKGDRHSALGMAGVAVQAGARSTLASLWLVDADATAALMGNFYKGLKNGLPKAEALRQAQVSLMENPKYNHPSYWGAFSLIGSYL